MPIIIALQGGLRTGKSVTIGFLYDLMKENNYTALRDRRVEGSKDFFAVLQKNKTKIGITSYATNIVRIRSQLDTFIDCGCNILVFVCYSRELIKKEIEKYPGFKKIFIPKTLKKFKSNKETANLSDAKNILTIIENAIHTE